MRPEASCPRLTSVLRRRASEQRRFLKISTCIAYLCLFVAVFTSVACSGTSQDRGALPNQNASAAISATQGADALLSWAGSYEFTDSAGRTVGGTGVVTTYRLEIPRTRRPKARCMLWASRSTGRCGARCPPRRLE